MAEVIQYTADIVEEISVAESPKKIREISRSITDRMSPNGPINIVIGQDKTTVEMSIEEQKGRVLCVMNWLRASRANVFNYFPLTFRLGQILSEDFREKELSEAQKDSIQEKIVEEFFKPILVEIERPKIRLVPGWRHSTPCWQIREFAMKKRLAISEISDFHIELAKRLAEKNQKEL